jgi:hypothetical protein
VTYGTSDNYATALSRSGLVPARLRDRPDLIEAIAAALTGPDQEAATDDKREVDP